MKDLQALLSLAILMHSAIGSPDQPFTSSVQRLFGLPLLPLMRPCRTVVQRFSARTIWPKYFNSRHWISGRKRRLGASSSRIDWFVLCSVQLILIILRYTDISNVSTSIIAAAVLLFSCFDATSWTTVRASGLYKPATAWPGENVFHWKPSRNWKLRSV